MRHCRRYRRLSTRQLLLSILSAASFHSLPLRAQECAAGVPVLALGHERRLATGDNPVDVVTLDVDHDGSLDLVSANEDGSDLSVLLGGGDGTFAPPLPAGEGDGANAVKTADFDGDGWLDLVAGFRRRAGFEVLLTKAGGRLSLRGPFGVDSNVAPASITVLNLNGDGRPDLLVSYPSSSKVTALIGADNVSFTEVEAPPLVDYCRQIAGADWNLDGIADLAASRCSPPGIQVLPGKSGGGYLPGLFFELSNPPSALLAADVNQDGRTDLVSAIARSETLGFLWGSAAGELLAVAEWPVNEALGEMVLLDLSGDNVPDLVAAGDGQVSVLEGAGLGQLKRPRVYSIGQGGLGLATGDFDRDGLADVAATGSQNGDSLAVLFNAGGGQLRALSRVKLAGESIGAAARDMNGDRLADLIVSARSPDQLQIHLNLGKRRFERSWETRAAPTPGLAAGDFNGDGKPDIVKSAENAQQFEVFPGDGKGALSDPGPATTAESSGEHVFLVFDQDGDAADDLVVIADGRVSTFARHLDGGFQERRSLPAPNGTRRGAAGDINRDGAADIVTGDNSGSSAVILGRVLGGYEEATVYPECEHGVVGIALGDFNRDQYLDVVASCDAAASVTIRQGGVSGALSGPQPFDADSRVIGLVAADLNQDGDLDVAVTSESTGLLTVLLGAGDGTLVRAEAFAVGELPINLGAADLDGDGAIDLHVISNRPSASTRDLLVVWNDSLRVARDCNRNGRADSCDLRQGVSRDLDQDGVLDECQTGLQLPGDCNLDGQFDLSDAICILNVLFLGRPDRFPCGDGTASSEANLALLDAQSDGRLDLADAVGVLAFQFQGGPPPAYHDTSAGGESCRPLPGCPDGPRCR